MSTIEIVTSKDIASWPRMDNGILYFGDNGTMRIHPKFIDEMYPDIIKIEELIPHKVTRITFGDKTTEKVVRQDDDTPDLKTACLFAIAKKLYRNKLTWDGIEFKATHDLKFDKEINKIINNAIKKYKQDQKDKLKKIYDDVVKKMQQQRQREKKIKYKGRREALKAQKRIAEITEAIKQAHITTSDLIKK